MMKKIITVLILSLLIIMPSNCVEVFASGASVEIKVNGSIKKDANIEILVDVKNVDKLYAGSVNYTYDTSKLKINSIKATDFVTKYSDEIMELGGETDKNGNTASYSFTFLGDRQGLSGSNTLVKLEATVLEDGDLKIDSNNMEVKLVQRSGDDVVNYPINFLEYNSKNTNNSEQDRVTIIDHDSEESITNGNSNDDNNQQSISPQINNNDISDNNNEQHINNVDKDNNEQEKGSEGTVNNKSENYLNNKSSNGISNKIIIISIMLGVLIISWLAYILTKKNKKL